MAAGKVLKVPKRPIGIWNCRHFTFSVILGISKPTYTQEQLDEMNKKNTNGWTDTSGILGERGKHYTLYDVTQEFRNIESEVRKLKDAQILARATNDMDGARMYQQDINNFMNTYSKLEKAVAKYNVLSRRDKMSVTGYRKIGV